MACIANQCWQGVKEQRLLPFRPRDCEDQFESEGFALTLPRASFDPRSGDGLVPCVNKQVS